MTVPTERASRDAIICLQSSVREAADHLGRRIGSPDVLDGLGSLLSRDAAGSVDALFVVADSARMGPEDLAHRVARPIAEARPDVALGFLYGSPSETARLAARLPARPAELEARDQPVFAHPDRAPGTTG